MFNLKTIVIGTVVAMFGAVVLTVAMPKLTTAAPAPAASCGDSLLGFPAWYKGLTEPAPSCKIKNPKDVFPAVGGVDDDQAVSKYVWRIVLNVVEFALRVIGILAFGFILYGGFQYLTSSGSPDKAAGAMKTIVNASVGLIIALSVIALQGFIWDVVLGSTNDYGVYEGTATNVLKKALDLVYFIAGAIAVIMIVIGGLNYATSSGDPGKMTKAKNTILYAVIGLVVIIAAWAITAFVVERF